MKIGIFGGTFNPIHKGHIYLADAFIQKLNLEKVLIIPTNYPPHKETLEIVPANHRLMMCKLATMDYPVFTVSDIEIRLRGRSYTYNTLRVCNTQYPDSEFYLIVGSDMFFTINNWKNAHEIFNLATICTASRNKGEFQKLCSYADDLKQQGIRCEVLDLEPIEISSTEIRAEIKKGIFLEKWLNPKVCEYIQENSLYLF